MNSAEATKLFNNADLSFESDSDVDELTKVVEIAFESKTLVQFLGTVGGDNKSVMVANEEPKPGNGLAISPIIVNKSEVIFESDDEEVEKENSSSQLEMIFNSTLPPNNDSAVSSKSISLETTTPPTPPEQLKREVTIVAKTCANTSISLVLGRGGYYCQLKTIINSPDPYGIYWCPYPKCNTKSRKKYLLKDHLRKTHHGPFFCGQCGIVFLRLPCLNRHLKQSGHVRYNNDPGVNEDLRTHTVAAIERFYSHIYQELTSAPGYILLT